MEKIDTSNKEVSLLDKIRSVMRKSSSFSKSCDTQDSNELIEGRDASNEPPSRPFK